MNITLANIPTATLDGEGHHVAINRRNGKTKTFIDGKLTKKEK